MRTVEVALGKRSYRIVVGAGLLEQCGPQVAAVLSPGKALVVTDETVAGLYLAAAERSLSKAGFAVSSIAVPPGEESKSHKQLLELYQSCFESHLERSSLVVALGGGVVGDLAGYAAATYLRGMPYVQAPTTLLAQADSSVGGKTAVNLPGGKNLVGAFHQPSLVLADVATLATLNDRQFASGMAEVVKHAMIRDEALFELLEKVSDKLERRDAATLEEVVAWNCRIKAGVVAADERESGLRAILNYGHTVGHAIETVASYGAYTHGEAVALGINAEADIARQRGDITLDEHVRQQDLLERVGLPSRLRAKLSAEKLLSAMQHDKKVQGGRVRFVLPTAVGKVHVVDDVTEAELNEALERLQP